MSATPVKDVPNHSVNLQLVQNTAKAFLSAHDSTGGGAEFIILE
jgi:hypothetical protein